MVRKLKNTAHKALAVIANKMYGSPARNLYTIGVTGTDGKTTTSSLIFHMLKTAGLRVAVVTTVGAQIGGNEYDTGLHTTTPSPFTLQKYIKKAAEAKCEYLVLEVTSHALDQNRVHGINFKIGVLTNITHEHFDYHGNYEGYLNAKLKLFRLASVNVLNRDDESFEKIKKACIDKKIISYSVRNSADVNEKNIGFKLPDTFDFNKENFLAAISVAKELRIPNEKIQLAIKSFRFPSGRQEIVYDKDFKVVIDFAHTPNSFAKILPGLKKNAKGRLIHVFGAAGERDRSKRSLMGEVSEKNADVIVLTSEDPRNEEVDEVNAQIMAGVKHFNEYDNKLFEGKLEKNAIFQIPDRLEAINFAIRIAKPGDVVIITGKGHEQSMNMGQGEVPWSEHKAVEKALKALGAKRNE